MTGGTSAQAPFVVVVNPRAGAGRAEERLPAIEAALRARGATFEVRRTQASGDATRIVREVLRDGARGVVVVGGDGTLSEATNGFFTSAGEPVAAGAWLAPLSAGTGGDFRKTIGSVNVAASGRGIGEAVDRFLSARPRPIDVGWLRFVNDDGTDGARAFLNIASFGMGGLVDRLVNEAPKSLGGGPAFLIGAIRGLGRYVPKRVRVTVDDAPPFEVLIQNLMVANGQFFGGGMHIAPRAVIDDGLFDVVTLEEIGTLRSLGRAPALYSGKILEAPGVRFTRGMRVFAEPVTPSEHVLLDVDGEAPGRLPATFQMRAGALLLRG